MMIDKVLKFIEGIFIGIAFTIVSALFGNIFFNALLRFIPDTWILVVSWFVGAACFVILVYILRNSSFGKKFSIFSLIFGVVISFMSALFIIFYGLSLSV